MSSKVLTTISPSTNKAVLTRSEVTDAEALALPVRAMEAFNQFRKTSLKQRQDIVEKALDLIIQKQDVLARELTEQMGRPISYTTKEITTAISRCRYLLKISEDALKDTEGEAELGFKRYIRKDPVGAVLIIFAWNVSYSHTCHLLYLRLPGKYPYLILVNSLIPALLAGNAVILKPSPQTPTIAEQIQDTFSQAGLPQDVIQYFHCGSNIKLERIVKSPHIHLICFTGSVAGGLQVQRSVADRVVPLALELGGKDPAYVREDVNVRWAAEEIVDGALFNSGQSCCSIERVYVAEPIHNRFISDIQNVLRGYKLGDPFDPSTNLGPVVSKRSAETIRGHIKDAVDKGAVDKTPQNASFENPPSEGNYVKPTLLTNVTHEMKIVNEETFGPVIPVISVGSDEEAVRMMNDSNFGLTASIWSSNAAAAEDLAEQVDAGTVFVNRCDFPSPVRIHNYYGSDSASPLLV